MSKLTPFADDAASIGIGELTIENGTSRVALYGSLDITRDKTGLKQALALKAVLDEVVGALQADKALPDRVAPAEKPKSVKNPFG